MCSAKKTKLKETIHTHPHHACTGQKLEPEVTAYLKRISYDGPFPFEPDSSALARLQECHLHSVPYENLDITNHIPLSLEIPALYDKIVTRRRGGYCFELCELFGWLLQKLGYKVENYFARFWRDEPAPPPMRRHHVLKVEAGGEQYLCDVGVGGIVPRRPVILAEGLIQQQGDESYRLERDPFFGWCLCEMKDGSWRRIYSFTEEPQLSIDYVMSSFWCEHSPDSIFTRSAMAAIRTREGRNTLAGNEFRIFTTSGVKTFTPQTQKDFDNALQIYFGIYLHPEIAPAS